MPQYRLKKAKEFPWSSLSQVARDSEITPQRLGRILIELDISIVRVGYVILISHHDLPVIQHHLRLSQKSGTSL